jgi:hypothetical protein
MKISEFSPATDLYNVTNVIKYWFKENYVFEPQVLSLIEVSDGIPTYCKTSVSFHLRPLKNKRIEIKIFCDMTLCYWVIPISEDFDLYQRNCENLKLRTIKKWFAVIENLEGSAREIDSGDGSARRQGIQFRSGFYVEARSFRV